MIIDTVYEMVQKLMAKYTAGGYLSPVDFNSFAELSQNEKLENDLSQKAATTFNTESLSNFQVNVSLPVVDGKITNPTDYRYFWTAYNMETVTPGGRPAAVEEVAPAEWDFRLASELDYPEPEFPVLVQRDGYLQVEPKTIQSLNFTYIKNPPVPMWAYTIVNNRPVFDANSSTDFLYTEGDIPDLVYRILVMAGVQIRDGELTQAAIAERK
jgi:hypothetical protein